MQVLKKVRWLLAFGLLLVPAVALAAQTQADESAVTVRADVTVADDLYTVSDTVTVTGTVQGSVIAAAGTVTINGTVTGDVWVLAGDVTVSGSVGGSVRTGSGTVTVSGKVGGDVLAASGEVIVSKGGTVGRDVYAAAGTVVIDGTVGRDLKITSDKLTVGGAIGRNASVKTSEAPQLIDGASVAGQVKYTSRGEISKAATAVVGGQVIHDQDRDTNEADGIAGKFFGQLYFFTAAILLLLVLLLVARRAMVAGADLLVKRPGWAALAGFLFILAAPIAILITAITFIGIPLALIGIVKYVIMLYAAKIFAGLAVGMAIFRTRRDSFFYAFGAGALGLVVFYFLAALPFIGWVVTAVAVILGTGAQLLLAQQIWRDNRKKYGS